MDYEEATKQANELIQQSIPLLTRETSLKAPVYRRADTTNLDYETARLRSERDVAQSQIFQGMQEAGEATAAEKVAIKARGQAEADSATADREKAERDAAVFANYARVFGIDPNDVGALVHSMNSERTKALAEASEIQQRQSVTIFDNPVEWWGNQLTLPSKINAYNTRASVINTMQDSLDSYIASADKAATFSLKGLPTITAAQAKAKADAAIATAAQLSAAADLNLAKTNVEFAKSQFAIDLAVAGQTLQSTQLEIQQNTNEFNAQIHAIQFADNHSNRLIRAAELLEKIAKNEDEAAQRKQIAVVLKNFDRQTGRPEGTTNYQMWRLMKDSDRNNITAIGMGSMGATPVSGVANYFQYRGPLASPETNRFMEHVREMIQDTSTSAAVQALDEKQKIDRINKVVKDNLIEEINTASKFGSYFYELSPGRMIAASQMNKDSVVAKSLEPLFKEERNVPTELVVATIGKAFNNPVDAGAAVADYYKRNIALRNGVLNTRVLGLELPDTYKVKVHLGAFATANLDLTKPEDATKYLLILQNPHYKTMGIEVGTPGGL